MEVLIIFGEVRAVFGTRLLTSSVGTQLSNGCNYRPGHGVAGAAHCACPDHLWGGGGQSV